MGSTTTSRLLTAGLAVALTACVRPHISPLAPPPYRAEVAAGYDATWTALIRAVAQQNFAVRVLARDSGVIASDDIITPIGLYADCGRLGDDRLEGEALVSFTLFVEASGDTTRVQINSQMRTQAHRRGSSGSLKSKPVYQCASTGRFEANLLDAVRELVKK